MSNPPDDAHVESAHAHLADATQSIADASSSMADATAALARTPEVESVVVIDTPDALDRALSAANPGAVLELAATLVYPAPLVLRTPVTLVSDTYVSRRGTRMTIDEPAPRFLGGLLAPGDDIALLGLEGRHPNPAYAIATFSGARPRGERLRLLGDAVKGGRRGIDYTGSFGQFADGYVDEIKLKDQDSQAFYSDNMGPGGLTLSNMFFCAAGESVMFGGGSPGSAARIPQGIRMDRCLLTKRPEWLVRTGTRSLWQCKNALELKDCIDFEMTNSIMEYGGISEGQSAFIIVLTPRNQKPGKDPWSTVRNVRILNCIARHGGNGVLLNGDDDVYPSGRLTDVRIENLVVEDLDHATYGGNGRVIYINRAPDGVTIDGLTASGTNLKSIVYCDEKVPPTRLHLKNFKVPVVPYAYHNLYGETLASLKKFAPDALLEITPTDVGARTP